jgi:uncharacterized protein (DUF1778 family)
MPAAQRAGISARTPGRSRKGSVAKNPKKAASKTYNLRVDEDTDLIIEQARAITGQNRTEFLLTSAKVRAQELLLSKAHFKLSNDAWKAFEEDLAAPAVPTAELVALMSRTPQWEK